MAKPNYDINILVVDDDKMVLEVIVEYLEYFGLCNVERITKPQRALQYIQNTKNPIDLILSDWEMKYLSGLDLLKATRGNSFRSRTPFIMITSQGSMERVKITQAVHSKVDGYIIKPFKAETLREKIWKLMDWDEENEEAV